MTAKQWPNKLGWDVGSAEVFKQNNHFRVFTPTRVLLVSYKTTTDPVEAVRLCRAKGLSRSKLDDMNYADAQALFLASAI